ncbi:hypothetical protein O6H91_Y458000 [Diphasiastrum complanatum]|nr:hypothetical protein O6H91_Y458000 [Diphasiastrum complanatum]
MDQDLFVAVCYFDPHTSVFMNLERTAARQTEFYADTLSLHPLDTSYAHNSQDSSATVTLFGEQLLRLAQAHGLIIRNGLLQWPSSSAYTCHPFGGGHSVVDPSSSFF